MDTHEKAMLAADRATIAVSGSWGARGIKPKNGLEGMERRSRYGQEEATRGIKTKNGLEGMESRSLWVRDG